MLKTPRFLILHSETSRFFKFSCDDVGGGLNHLLRAYIYYIGLIILYSSTILMYLLAIMMYSLSCTTAKMRHVSFIASKITVRNGVLDVVNHRFFTTKVRPDNALTMNDISNADAADNTAKTTIENDDAIARQKKRAIQYWNDSKSKHIEAMKGEYYWE